MQQPVWRGPFLDLTGAGYPHCYSPIPPSTVALPCRLSCRPRETPAGQSYPGILHIPCGGAWHPGRLVAYDACTCTDLSSILRVVLPMWSAFSEMPPGYCIRRDAVHVWLTRVDWPEECKQALAEYLSPDERARAVRFHHRVDSDRHVISRALTRLLLGQLSGARPCNVPITYGEFGKPRIAEGQNQHCLQFNISHSGHLILIGIAVDREIGVDVEQMHEHVEIDVIAGRLFSLEEQAGMSIAPPGEKREAFFRCWTRKEAFLKAQGSGLSLPLGRFDVSGAPGEPVIVRTIRPHRTVTRRWIVRDLEVGAGHKAAVAFEAPDCEVNAMEWRPSLEGMRKASG